MLRRQLPLMLLALTLLAGLIHPARASTVAIPTPDALMDWAERAYPAHFPGHPATGSSPPYLYRHYAATGNLIGVAGTGVWLQGPVAGSDQPVYVGELSAFACRVYAAQCGTQVTRQWTVAGLAREAVVYTPWKATPAGGATGSVPVVFVLHGTGGDGPRFFGLAGWREKADEEGFIVVFPSALVHCYYDDDNENGLFEAPAERKVSTKWAGGRLGLASQRPLCSAEDIAQLDAAQRALADHPLADDMAFFRQMIATLVAEHPADARRVYAAGFSNGAEMSTRLAMEASTQFAAVASHAGPGPLPGSQAARPLSLVYTLGQLDAEIAPKLGYPNGLPMNGSLVFNSAVQAAFVEPYTSALRLSPGASYAAVTVAGAPTTQFVWRNSPTGSGNFFGLVAIGELAHAYPNGINHPLRLADPLWEVLKSQVLPQQ